jgi:phage I-like protein
MKTFLDKKSLTQGIGLAVLTKQAVTNVAVLTFAGSSIDTASLSDGNRVQILPDGYFMPTDGRDVDVDGGQWLMDELAFSSLQTNLAQRKNDFMFDYEHQTLYTEQNGKPAPAAGWFKKLDYVPGEGLFAVNVDWTPTATKHISDKEYRYTSAVFSYDIKTGRPIELLHVALTNEPALDGMKAITALKNNSNHHSTGVPPMNEALKIMLDLLGIAHTDDDLSNVAALTAIQDKAKVAITALKSKADKTGQLEKDLNTAQTSVTALKANAATADGNVDLSKFVPKETYDAAITQVAALKATGDSNSVDQLLKDNADKVFESEIGYLTDFGKQQGFVALKKMVDARPAIAALKTKQTQGKKAPGENVAALTAEQQYTADQLGLSHKDFLATINKETK